MKLTILNNINIESTDVLNFYRDAQQSEKFIVTGQETRIFEIKSQPTSVDGAYLKIEFIKPPEEKPTKSIVLNNNMSALYQDSNIFQRQTICIDPLFAAEFSDGNIESVAQHICWPKRNSFKRNIAAVVTNFGQCNIFEINNITRTYEKTLMTLNSLLDEIYEKKVAVSFDTLNKQIQDHVITTCCWMQIDRNILVFSTISGWLFAAEIREDSVHLISKLQTNIYKIIKIQVFNLLNENNESINIIIYSNLNGLIDLCCFVNNEIKSICSLWDKQDKMSCNQFDLYFERESSELIVVTSKGYHLIVIVVSVKDWTVLYKGNEYCRGKIANFERISEYKYIVSTQLGQVMCVEIVKKSKGEYIFKTELVEHNFEIENYILSGMAASRNKIAWMFVMSPEKSFVLGRQKRESLIYVCSFDHLDPMHVLKDYERQIGDARQFTDCYEVIRLQLNKNSIANNFHAYDFQPVLIDWNLLHRLRIRYNVVNALVGYNLIKTKNVDEIYENEVDCIKLSIKAIFAYWRLLRMSKEIDVLSDFQKLSAKCLLKTLKSFLNIAFDDQTSYKTLQNSLAHISNDITERFESICNVICEFCSFCGGNTDVPKPNCSHNIGRCCLSEVQIQSLDMKYCEVCGDIAINDEELLMQIQLDADDNRCPICDYILLE